MAVKGIAILKNPKNEAKPMFHQAKRNARNRKNPFPSNEASADVAGSEEGSRNQKIPSIQNEAKPMFQTAKRKAATKKSLPSKTRRSRCFKQRRGKPQPKNPFHPKRGEANVSVSEEESPQSKEILSHPTRRQPMLQAAKREAAIKRNPSHPTRRQPMLQAAKREAATEKILPIQRGVSRCCRQRRGKPRP